MQKCDHDGKQSRYLLRIVPLVAPSAILWLSGLCSLPFRLFGWNWRIFGHTIFATLVAVFVAAFAFGILFQYFTIKPTKNLSPAS
jgi:hypothetical protein